MRQNQDRSTTPSSSNAFASVSLCDKGGVLGGSGICRILPAGASGSAGKTENCRPDPGFDLQRRFCCKKSGCARLFSIFPRTSGKRGPVSRALATMAASATTSSSRGNLKGPLPKTRQRPFFVSASRRIHSDCISEGMLQQHQHPGFSEMRPLFCKLIPNLEAIQLVIWQITVFL